ncbi:hypothetical protein GGR55DRAFT_397134 [Xylaria sp. FL0064]|nr:hypothetical protein GGR55DRAFT_397134 [Xylaria sp. FL0064]
MHFTYFFTLAVSTTLVTGNVIPSLARQVNDNSTDDGLDLPSPDLDAIFATPDTDEGHYETGGLIREPLSNTTLAVEGLEAAKAWTCTKKGHSKHTKGDKVQGHGIKLTNGDKVARSFYLYHNSCDSVPWKHITIPAGKTRYVQVPALWEGRVTRGTDKLNLAGVPRPLGTWFEFSLDKYGVIWGDVSLIRGTDGAVALWSTDDMTRRRTGFRQWVLDGAPKGAYSKKADGKKVIGPTEGKDAVIRPVPRNWVLKKVGAKHAYVDDSHAKPVINSNNGRFGVWFGRGRV